MKNYTVIFRTETNWNGQLEHVQAENKGEAKAKVRDKHGKIVVYQIYEV